MRGHWAIPIIVSILVLGLFPLNDAFAVNGENLTEVFSLEHNPIFNGRWNSLVQVDSDTFALAYDGSGVGGYITTFTISEFVIVGGTSLPIDTTALLLAGVQSISMWMIPVVIAGIGIGVFVIMRIRQ